MKQIRKLLRLSKMDYFETHLSLINCVLPKQNRMTPMEIRVLAGFMSLEGDISRDRFGPTAKKIVMNTVNPEKPLSAPGLSNYISLLIEKGLIEKTNGSINIKPVIELESNEQVYMFKLVNNG